MKRTHKNRYANKKSSAHLDGIIKKHNHIISIVTCVCALVCVVMMFFPLINISVVDTFNPNDVVGNLNFLTIFSVPDFAGLFSDIYSALFITSMLLIFATSIYAVVINIINLLLTKNSTIAKLSNISTWIFSISGVFFLITSLFLNIFGSVGGSIGEFDYIGYIYTLTVPNIIIGALSIATLALTVALTIVRRRLKK